MVEVGKIVDSEAVTSLANYAVYCLISGPKNGVTFAPSTSFKREIAKRVTPKSIPEWNSSDRLPFLVGLEVANVGDRIRLYPMTARYREHMNHAPKEMFLAWQLHSHELRHNEVYTILQRGSKSLHFLYLVAQEVGIAASDFSKNFEKEFRKRLERRLRERHRLVHAHERPSLTSRVVDLMNSGSDKRDIQDAIVEVFTTLSKSGSFPSAVSGTTDELITDFKNQYAKIADLEAWKMYELYGESIANTFISTSQERERN